MLTPISHYWLLATLLGGSGLVSPPCDRPKHSSEAIVLWDGQVHKTAVSIADPDDLWVSPTTLHRITELTWKPEGLCTDEGCTPIPAHRRARIVLERDGTLWLNLGEVAELQGRAVTFERDPAVWCMGAIPTAPARSGRVSAPDFTLPDWHGDPVSLSEFAGQKVLLVTWASW